MEKTLVRRLEELKRNEHQDEAAAFGNHVAGRLRTFTPRQYAIACLQIEKILVDTQFPHNDPYSQTPSDYYDFD